MLKNCYATSIRKNGLYVKRTVKLKKSRKSSFVISLSLLFRLSAQYDLDSASLNSCIMKQ